LIVRIREKKNTSVLIGSQLLIATNGSAIKGVCVAERMQAGALIPNRGRVLVPAGMNEAWRIFCRPGTKPDELYECRGTSLIASRSQVKVQRVL
jgi:hypothetical protein